MHFSLHPTWSKAQLHCPHQMLFPTHPHGELKQKHNQICQTCIFYRWSYWSMKVHSSVWQHFSQGKTRRWEKPGHWTLCNLSSSGSATAHKIWSKFVQKTYCIGNAVRKRLQDLHTFPSGCDADQSYKLCLYCFPYWGNFPVTCEPWNGHLHYWFKKISSIRYGQSVDQRRDNSKRSSIGYGQSVDQGRVMTPRDLQLGMDNLLTKEGTIPRDLQLGYGQSVDQGRDNYYYA
jgi:hypothetical protein